MGAKFNIGDKVEVINHNSVWFKHKFFVTNIDNSNLPIKVNNKIDGKNIITCIPFGENELKLAKI